MRDSWCGVLIFLPQAQTGRAKRKRRRFASFTLAWRWHVARRRCSEYERGVGCTELQDIKTPIPLPGTGVKSP